MLKYKFGYRTNVATYKFKYSTYDKLYCESSQIILKKSNHDIDVHKTDAFYRQNNKIVLKNHTIQASDYIKYITWNTEIACIFNIQKSIEQQFLNNLENKYRQMNLCLNKSVDRNKILNFYITENFLIYRFDKIYVEVLSSIFCKNINLRFLNSQNNSYILKKSLYEISFKAALNILYRLFNSLKIERYAIAQKAIQNLIEYIQKLALSKLNYSVLPNVSQTLDMEYKSYNIADTIYLFNDAIEIINFENTYLSKNTISIGYFTIANDVKKYFKNISKIHNEINIIKDSKYTLAILDISTEFWHKDFKDIYRNLNTKLNKASKDIFNLVDIWFIKFNKDICILKPAIHTDKYFNPIIKYMFGYMIKGDKYIFNSVINKSTSNIQKSMTTAHIYGMLKDTYRYINIYNPYCNLSMHLKYIDIAEELIDTIISKRNLHIYQNVFLNNNNSRLICHDTYINLEILKMLYLHDYNIKLKKSTDKHINSKYLIYWLFKYNKVLNIVDTILDLTKTESGIYVSSKLNLFNTVPKNIDSVSFNMEHGLKLWKRFWFLCADGQVDNMILPNCDYPYETEPLNSIYSHPIEQGKNLGIEEIPLSINIMVDVINILIFMWCKFYNAFWGYTGTQAVTGIVSCTYTWLTLETSIDEQLQKGSKKHYDRCYRWLRWKAEKVIIMARNDIQLRGNYYVQILIENLIQYMVDHHFDTMPIFKDIQRMDEFRNIFGDKLENNIEWVLNKVKGIRHTILKKLREE